MQDVIFHSAVIQRDMPYRVYLPEQIASGQKLPVVYLLHGGGQDFKEWSNNSDVARYAAHGLILVMPEGAFSYYMNEAGKPREKYEDYITNDLVADVETRFAAATGRQNRAIIGISMGGFAAIKYALSRPELFAFIGALSPPVDILHRRFNIKRWGEWWRTRTNFGPSGNESRRMRDPLALVQIAEPARTPYIYLSAGQNEPLLAPVRRFNTQLGQRRFGYEFHTRPGGHDWSQWNSQLPACFAALRQHGIGCCQCSLPLACAMPVLPLRRRSSRDTCKHIRPSAPLGACGGAPPQLVTTKLLHR